MQNLKFVALPVPEIIIRYIGILSLRYPHTSGLPCDAGISCDHVTAPPMVIYNHGRAWACRRRRGKSQRHTSIDDCTVARNIDCHSTFFHPNFGGVPVAPDARGCWGQPGAEALSYLAVKLFSKNSNLCDHGT